MLPPAWLRRSRHARRTLRNAFTHHRHHLSPEEGAVRPPSGPIRRLASRPPSSSWLASSACLFGARGGTSSPGVSLLVRVFGVPPWRIPSLDAVCALSILEASESELLRGLPPLRVQDGETSNESPALGVEGVGLIDLARVCAVRSERWLESPAGTEPEDVDWCQRTMAGLVSCGLQRQG